MADFTTAAAASTDASGSDAPSQVSTPLAVIDDAKDDQVRCLIVCILFFTLLQAVSAVVDQFKVLATAEKTEADRVRIVQSEESHLRAAITFEDPQLKL